jgi:hypothetical protein
MKVEALDNQKTTKIKTYPVDNFVWYIVASRGSGKTTLVINALLKLYLNQFNKIYWVSPTSKLDVKTQILKESEILTPNKPLIRLMNKLSRQKNKEILSDPNQMEIIDINEVERKMTDDNFIEELTPELMEEIIEEQRFITESYGKQFSDRILMIMDDSIDSKIITSKYFKDLILKGRHYNISNIIISQSYRLLPKYIRTNSNFISLFETGNRKEMEILYNELHNNLSKKDWEDMYKEITNIPYGFLSINYNNPKGYRFIQNLDKIIKIT